MDEELFKAKVIALLHDPPWKPWSVTASVEDEVKRSGSALDEGFLKNFGVSYYDKAEDVHERDGLTFAKLLGITDADIEKYIGVVHKADAFSASLERFAVRGGKPVKQSYKYNVFNPNHRIPLRDTVKKSCVQEYVKWVADIVNRHGQDWASKYHLLYALLEVAWYHFCPGYYPLADTRVGTYSVFDHVYATTSMLNWYIDGELGGYLVKVDLPGIQQVISKSRKIWDLWGGSYLLSWLAYRTVEPLIREYGADVVLSPFMGINPFFLGGLKELKEVGEISGEAIYWEYGDLMLNPTQPVMPATVLLALPRRAGGNEEEVKERVKELYSRAWERVVDEVGEFFARGVRDRVVNLLRGAPITPLRVRAIDVSDGMKTAESQGFKYNFTKFSYLIHLIDMKEDRYVKVLYGITANARANEVSERAYSEGRLYRLCTSCGVLPAVVEERDDGDLEEGERLCQYCYLKRKVRRYVGSRYRLQVIPSTLTVANIYNWRDILRHGEELKDSSAELRQLETAAKDEELRRELEASKEWSLPAPLRAGGLDTPLNRLIFYYLTKREVMNKCVKAGHLKGLETYYAIVKGDGDYVGKKLWKGVVKAKGFKDYVERVVVGAVEVGAMQEEVERLAKAVGAEAGAGEAVVPVTPDYLIALSRSLMAVALKDAVTVSRDGFLVYAGGDDVAFLAPLSDMAALKLVIETRLNYWGARSLGDLSLERSEGAVGFIRFGGMVFDAPAAYGRSYGVYVAHYRDPFFYSWETAMELEEMKDVVEGKDVTVVLRSRGQPWPGAKGVAQDALGTPAVLRNSALDRVVELYELVKDGKLSRSLIKDVLGDELVRRGLLVREALAYYVKRNRKEKGLNYASPEDVNVFKAVDYLDDNYRGHGGEESYKGVVKCLS